MRAYLAIIKDSFREAIVSRVLWVLLILSALLLLLLSPFQVTETSGSTLTPADLRDPQGLFQRIYAGKDSATPSPEQQVWNSMDENWRDRLEDTVQDGEDDFMASAARFGMLIEGVNSAIRNPDFYNPTAFGDLSLPQEANDLIARNDLAESEVARRNRLILQTAFSSDIAGAAPAQITVSYFGKNFHGPLSGEGYEKTQYVTWWLTWFADYGVGVIGVFCAILVTASIIPQTFEQGAIDLLLSKPVNRPLVFLTKYLGGCIFICLVATFCVGGIWLLSGMRWGVWHLPFLMCIPVVTFIFAIYYAVSALAGVIWRNAIVSVIVTVAFWVLCYVVWAFHAVGESAMAPEAFVRVSESEAGLVGVRDGRNTVRWDGSKWQEILRPSDQMQQNPLVQLPSPLPVGPTFDVSKNRLYQINSPNLFSSSGPMLAYADLTDDGEWIEREGIEAPGGADEMFIYQGELFTVAPQGVSRLEGDPNPPDEQPLLWGLVNIPTPGGNAGGTFVSASESLQISQPFSADADPQTGKIVLTNASQVVVMSADETGKTYSVERERTIEDERTRIGAIGGNTIALAQEDGWVKILNVSDLAERSSFKLPGKNTPRFIVASPSGRWFAVITHQKRIWMYDADEDQPARVRVSGQGDISTAAFTQDDGLLVVDALDQVTSYNLPDFSVTETRAPEIEGGRAFMWYGVNPIYTIFPKPGELGDLMRYMVYETAAQGESEDLSQQRTTLNVWQPVWSNLLFMAVVLGLGSLYIWRKDF